MAQDNFDRQTEDSSRALDRPQEYPLGPDSCYPSQGLPPDHPAAEMDRHNRPARGAHHGIDQHVHDETAVQSNDNDQDRNG
jgi:hypothetical protein